MKLNHGLHLAYCTNVHPGESWAETLASLNRWTLAVKNRLACQGPYAIGLRLSDLAARELSEPGTLAEFQHWLELHGCYVFTINGFPFGRFHGTRVKEQVYVPDWTQADRLDYTNRLFEILARLVPEGVEGSVSTLPGSFKEFIHEPGQVQAIRENLWRCVEQTARLSERTGRALHLGLEPEPLGLIENSAETTRFFDQLREQHPGDPRLGRHLGVNYDTCHFAVEFEEPGAALAALRAHEIRLSKLHISNALRLRPSAAARSRVGAFADEVYLHQVIARKPDGSLVRWKDLPQALRAANASKGLDTDEWRVHFHVPLHCQTADEFDTTSDHVLGMFQLLGAEPHLCAHLEMETYTWAVLPDALKSRDVSEQIVSEYHWTLRHLAEHGLAGARWAAPAA
jgi:sugar phosphate isomerase/epimerase